MSRAWPGVTVSGRTGKRKLNRRASLRALLPPKPKKRRGVKSRNGY
jgi:hypothetical protein